MHAAHRRADYKAKVVDLEAVDEQPPLGLDHVAVAVFWELCSESVAGLRRLAVTDVVGDHDVPLTRVKRLADAEQLRGEFRPEELVAAAARAVEDQHGVLHDAVV